jgi:hypothetical protein
MPALRELGRVDDDINSKRIFLSNVYASLLVRKATRYDRLYPIRYKALPSREI